MGVGHIIGVGVDVGNTNGGTGVGVTGLEILLRAGFPQALKINACDPW